MKSRNDVIRGLECCKVHGAVATGELGIYCGDECPTECPYSEKNDSPCYCLENLVADAIALLKTQEPTDGDTISRSALLAAYDAAHKGPPGGARKLIEEAPAVALKAKEPRVMTLEEVKNAEREHAPLFYESPYLESFGWRFGYTRHIKGANVVQHILENLHQRSVSPEHLYGITWRCWTTRPTDAQREEMKWE